MKAHNTGFWQGLWKIYLETCVSFILAAGCGLLICSLFYFSDYPLLSCLCDKWPSCEAKTNNHINFWRLGAISYRGADYEAWITCAEVHHKIFQIQSGVGGRIGRIFPHTYSITLAPTPLVVLWQIQARIIVLFSHPVLSWSKFCIEFRVFYIFGCIL